MKSYFFAMLLQWTLSTNLLLLICVVFANASEQQIVVDTNFKALENCSVDFAYPKDTPSDSTSLIDCARRCSEEVSCTAINYQPAIKGFGKCGKVYVRAQSCLDLDFVPGAKHLLKSETAQESGTSSSTKWSRVLSQKNGVTVEGKISDLIKMIKLGSPLRVLIDREGYKGKENAAELYSVDSTWLENNTVIAEVFTWTSSEYDEPSWTKLQVNTSGWVNKVVYNGRLDEFKANIQWFVRGSESTLTESVVLEMNSNGAILQGSIHFLFYVVEQLGFQVQIVERQTDNTWRSFTVVNASVSQQEEKLSLFGAWMGSYPYPTDDVYFNSQIATFRNEYFFFGYYSGLDVMNVKATSYPVFDSINVTMTMDPYWDKVFANDPGGKTLHGSYAALVERIMSGADIRVTYQCAGSIFTEALDAGHLFIDDVMVIAYHFTPTIVDDDEYDGQSEFAWMRRQVHTNGTVRQSIVERVGGRLRPSECQGQVTWFTSFTSRDQVDFGNGINLNEDILYQGLMPRVILQRNDDLSIHAFSLQMATNTHPFGSSMGDGKITLYGFNYRSFSDKSLAIFIFASNGSVVEETFHVSIDTSPGPTNRFTTKWMKWFV